jgi:hypothetical protein
MLAVTLVTKTEEKGKRRERSKECEGGKGINIKTRSREVRQ